MSFWYFWNPSDNKYTGCMPKVIIPGGGTDDTAPNGNCTDTAPPTKVIGAHSWNGSAWVAV